MNSRQIKSLRSKLDLTQEEFADRVGVDRVTVWRWEAGHTAPLPAFSDALNDLGKDVEEE